MIWLVPTPFKLAGVPVTLLHVPVTSVERGTSAYVNVRCICCCMLITEPGNWQYSLRAPLIVGIPVYTHRIRNHIY